MSFKIRMSAVVALICVVGCSAQDPGPLNEVQSELADAQAEITKLKAELHETTKRLHWRRRQKSAIPRRSCSPQ